LIGRKAVSFVLSAFVRWSDSVFLQIHVHSFEVSRGFSSKKALHQAERACSTFVTGRYFSCNYRTELREISGMIFIDF
jgi:hypothetical protein